MHTHADAGQTPTDNQSPRTFRRFHFQAGDADLIRQLPPLYQAILESEGAYGVRAAALNVPIGTVRSRLHRARKALQQLRDAREDAREETQKPAS